MQVPDDHQAGFSAQLRRATAEEHAAAERSGLAARLLSGAIDVDGYAVLAVQLRAVYGVLEEVARGVADDPVVGVLVDRSLERAAILERDVAWLVAHAATDVSTELLPATVGYLTRLREVASWPGGVIAHHYTRYLGDLSGGVAIGRALARSLGGGVDFHRFPARFDARAYKAAYRDRLDAAPWSEAERGRITAEVITAYRCNARLFGEVERVLRATDPAVTGAGA